MADAKPLKLRQGANSARIAGVDGRTSHARRFADILDGLVREFAGLDATALRSLAGLRLMSELCQADAIAGNKKARSDLVRVANLVSRKEKELRASLAKAKAEAPALSVRDLIAEASRAD